MHGRVICSVMRQAISIPAMMAIRVVMPICSCARVDVAARLRQFVLHKGVHQRADLMRAFAELPADLLFVLIGRQIGRDAVL